MLAVLVILGGSLSAFAIPPKRAQVIGAVYGGDGTIATRNLKIIPVNNNTFGIYSDTTLELCTRVYLYFRTDFDSIESFSFTLKLLSTAWQINYTSTNTVNCRLADISDSGVVSNGVFIGSATTLTKDTSNNSLNWLYSGNNAGRDSFIVTIDFQNFMLGESPIYFQVVDFSINGESTALTYSDEQLSQINEAINEDVPLPSAVPSLEEIGGEIVNEGLDLAQSWVQYFTTNFDIAGAMGRVVKPFSDYFLVMPTDGNNAHITLVVIMLFSLGAVLVVWLINKLKRRQDDA